MFAMLSCRSLGGREASPGDALGSVRGESSCVCNSKCWRLPGPEAGAAWRLQSSAWSAPATRAVIGCLPAKRRVRSISWVGQNYVDGG